MATVVVLLQVAALYVFAAVLKSGKEWFPDGTAAYYALHLDIFTTPFGIWIRQFPDLLRGLTYLTYGLEAVGGLLIFFPIKNELFRFVAFALLAGMHAGFSVAMDIGLFAYIDITALILVLPSAFWNRLARFSIFKSSFTAIRSYLLSKRPIFSKPFNRLYRQPLREYRLSPLTEFLLMLLICYCILWNLTTIPRTTLVLPPSLIPIAQILRIDQGWGMFAPYPLKNDGWFVIHGVLLNGNDVDVLKGIAGAPNFEKPALLSSTFKTQRHQKFLLNMQTEANADYLLYWAKYLCRDWNNHHENQERLNSFKIFFVEELTQPDYQWSTPKRIQRWEHGCFKSS